ncbi:hypothetical protein SDC9_211633 [bioreactor metagenome]|uniref:Uncharacterized protein n=1 Tax=bioreactor metagenome TaxID=1076179 RepID=A0A645JKC1_9ZZZZ
MAEVEHPHLRVDGRGKRGSNPTGSSKVAGEHLLIGCPHPYGGRSRIPGSMDYCKPLLETRSLGRFLGYGSSSADSLLQTRQLLT